MLPLKGRHNNSLQPTRNCAALINHGNCSRLNSGVRRRSLKGDEESSRIEDREHKANVSDQGSMTTAA
jgi:hypothetical protein